MSLGHGAKIVREGLVLHLDAANPKSYPGTGTTWSDLSGNGNNGTLTNGPTYSATNKGYFSFDGTNDYIDTNLDTQPSAMPETTWCLYFQTLSSSGNRTIIACDDNGYDRAIETSRGDGYFNIFTGNGTWKPLQCTLNEWMFISVVYKTNNILFYKNNVEYVSGITPIGQATSNKLNIGRNQPNGEYFLGYISKVQVYNRALSAIEIRQNFEATRDRYGI